VVVVDESGASHEVKLVLELAWELGWLVESVLVQFFVDTLVGGLFKHVWADVKANDVFEASTGQVFTDETSSAAKIHDLNVFEILTVLVGNLLDVFCTELGIGVAHLEVHTLVVGGEIVVVDLGISLVELVASVKQFDVLLRKLDVIAPLQSLHWLIISVRHCR